MLPLRPAEPAHLGEQTRDVLAGSRDEIKVRGTCGSRLEGHVHVVAALRSIATREDEVTSAHVVPTFHGGNPRPWRGRLYPRLDCVQVIV